MNGEGLSPHIPAECAELWDDRAREAHAHLASLSKKDIIAGMPEVKRWAGDRAMAGFVDLRPTEYDGNAPTIAVTLPFANDWGPNMAARMRLLQTSLPAPQRIIVFPNNTVHARSMYAFDKDARHFVVDNGDFGPLAERQFRTLDTLGIDNIQIVGYSQGAAVGAAALRLADQNGHFAVGNSALFEAPNVLERSAKQLRGDFTGGGTQMFNKAVNESAVLALSRIQHARGGLDTLRQYKMFAEFGASTLLKENRIISGGFLHDTFGDDVIAALRENSSLRITIASGDRSRIMPLKAMRNLQERLHSHRYKNADLLVLKGYGHEWGDNIVAFTLLARAAIGGK